MQKGKRGRGRPRRGGDDDNDGGNDGEEEGKGDEEEEEGDDGEEEDRTRGRDKKTALSSLTPRRRLRGTILFYGDSITFGMPHNYTGRYETPWPRLLAAKLARRGYRVVEAGLNR